MLLRLSYDLASNEYVLREEIGENNLAKNYDHFLSLGLYKYIFSNLSVFHSLDEAIEDMGKCIEMEPDREVPYRYRAEILSMKLMDQPDISEAERNKIIQKIRDDYLNARKIDPTSGWAWLGLIEASLLQQDWDKAISIYGESAAYTKTFAEQFNRALLGCVSLILAGEQIEEEDGRPLHDVRIADDVTRDRRFREGGLSPLLARLHFLVLKKIQNKPGWVKKWGMAHNIICEIIKKFNVWPKHKIDLFLGEFLSKRYDGYERTIELNWNNDKRIIELAQTAYSEVGRTTYNERSWWLPEEPETNETLATSLVITDKALKVKLDDSTLWYERAIILEGLGWAEEALTAINKVIELNTTSIGSMGRSARFTKAKLLNKMKRPLEALKVYDEIIMVDKDVLMRTMAWIKKAQIFSNLPWRPGTVRESGLKEALDAIEQAIELQPDFVEVWLHKAMILEGLDREEEASRAYDYAIHIRPYYSLLSGAMCCALCQIVMPPGRNRFPYMYQKFEEVVNKYDLLKCLTDNIGSVLVMKGLTLVTLGLFKESLDEYEKALMEGVPEGTIPTIWGFKAEVYAKMERYNEALSAYEEALKLDTSVWKKRDHLHKKAKLLEKLNRFDEAQKAIAMANKLVSSDK